MAECEKHESMRRLGSPCPYCQLDQLTKPARSVLQRDGMKQIVLIVVPHYWGRGDTIDDAWDSVRKASGRNLRDLKSGSHQIYAAFESETGSTSIDPTGLNMVYPQGYPPNLIHEVVK